MYLREVIVMILSIGMIVKNEEKYLGRCLSALKPVLDAVDSELIIADTGSSDNTVNIAKQYTDNVFHFEWCNDYSKARNATLKRSRGEWYMFVDADNILQNPEVIINFFNLGEYKKYEGATYIERNLLRSEYDFNTYSDFNAYRLIKLTKDVVFTGTIHEYLPPRKNLFSLPAIFIHYGYLWNKRTFYKKTKKYAEYLLRELSVDSNNPRIIIHLSEAYQSYDLYKSKKYILPFVSKRNKLFYVLLENAIHILYTINDHKLIINLYNKFKSSNSNLSYLNNYYRLVLLYYSIRQYNNIYSLFNHYISIRKMYLEKRIDIYESYFISLLYSDNDYMILIFVLLSSYIKQNDFKNAIKTLDKIYNFKNISAVSSINLMIYSVFELYKKMKDKEIFINFINFIKKNNLQKELLNFINKYIQTASDNFDNILNELYEYDANNRYYIYYKIYYMNKNNILDRNDCSKKLSQILPYNSGLIYFILKYSLPIPENYKMSFRFNEYHFSIECFTDWEKVLTNAMNNDLYEDYKINICELFFIKCHNNNIKHLSHIYYNEVCKYINKTINNNLPDDSLNLLPPNIYFKVLYKKLYESKLKNDVLQYKALLNEIKNIDISINIFKKVSEVTL